MTTVKRYVVTHISKEYGMRTLAHGAQGRHTFATREEAQKSIEQTLRNNSKDTLESVFGLPLEVRECECYPVHFDPVSIWFPTHKTGEFVK